MMSFALRRIIRRSLYCLCLLLGSAILCHSLATARTGAEFPRNSSPNQIDALADWTRLQPLPNHVPLWATPQNSTGLATAQMSLTIVLSPSSQQQTDLKKLLVDQKDPASPDYRHWLTPQEFGARFGLSDTDLAAIQNWIQSKGLQVTFVASGRNFVGISGSPAAIGRAFGTEIRKFMVNGSERIAPSSDPLLPAALAPVVKAIQGLYTIVDRPQHSITEPQISRPDLTISPGTNFIVPADFSTIYDGIVPASGFQQTIGIVGRSRTDPTDFQTFVQITSAPLQNVTEVVPTAFGGVDPGPAYTTPPPSGVSIADQGEATLDVTRAGTVAMNADLLLVVATQASGGIEADTQYLVQTSPVPAQIMNISFSACESESGKSGVDFWDSLFQQAAGEGISVFVSSGDSGASGCEQSFNTPQTTPSAISPNYICSSTYATCVGGTEFNDSSDPSKYWSTSNGTNLASAQQYIPEGGWNEPLNAQGQSQVAGSGGGVSAFIATPDWQAGPGVPSARAGRYTPDLSFSASCHDAYFGCLAAAGATCTPDSQGAISFLGMCGTSASAPSMAGVAALIDEETNHPQGNMNPEIYAMLQNQPSSFHDVTPASSGVATCDIDTPSMCNNSTPGPTGLTGGQQGFPVTTGYDLVTGVGSPDIAGFFKNFPTALPGPTVTLTPSAISITAVQQLTISVTATGGSSMPTPTGTIVLSTSDADYQTQATLSGGTATIVIPPNTLYASADSLTITARYQPDSASAEAYGLGSGTCQVSVAFIEPTVTVSFSPSNPTTAQNVAATVSVTAAAGDPTPTGGISLSVVQDGPSFTSVGGTLSNGSATLTIPAGILAPGSDRIGASYAPDQQAGGRAYSASLGDQNVTVTAGVMTTPTMTANLSASSITLGDSLTIFATVTPAAGAPTPTGTVSLSSNGKTLTNSVNSGIATISVLPDWLPVGNDTLALSYSGDYNNNAVTISPAVTVLKINPSMSLTPSLNSLQANQSLNVQVQLLVVNYVGSPTGTVALTSGSYISGAVSLVAGMTALTIPANSLAAGADTLTVTYSGDSNFNAATGTASVTVTAVPASFAVSADSVNIAAPGATANNTATITVAPAGGFTGSVNLTAEITSSPVSAQYAPTLSFGSTSPVTINGSAAASATLTISTTAPTAASLVPQSRMPSSWYSAVGTMLAFLTLFGIPARRIRKVRKLLGVTLLLVAVSGWISACGGGGGSGGGSIPPPAPTPAPGTTAGTYVVTVTAASASLSATTTVNVVVQ
jgi:subtilase family serine protease